MHEPALEIIDLELWRGERRLFTGLSFSVPPGSALHLQGPNGSGKTSLLRTVCGLTRPERGTIRWRGKSIEAATDEFHTEMTYVGHSDGLKDELNAAENLRYSLGFHRRLSDSDTQEALAGFGLDSRTSMLPACSLSAGQRRRVALVRAFVSGAALWMLDEPFTNLDTDGRDHVYERLTKHLSNGGSAIVTAHQSADLDGLPLQRLGLGG